MSRIHPQARTTPRTRAEINASTQPVKVLAQLYNITVATARKWHQRGSMEDRSHCPHKLSTVLTPAQEALQKSSLSQAELKARQAAITVARADQERRKAEQEAARLVLEQMQ